MVSRKSQHERSLRDLGRRGAFRAPRKSVLVVCEGEKTETIYFKAMKVDKSLGLSSVYVEVRGKECQSDPLAVVEFAAVRFRERKQEAMLSPSKVPFEEVFCVVDDDPDSNLGQALDLGSRLKSRGMPIHIIVSSPCFDFWFLLHHRFTTKPYRSYGELEPDLKKAMPGYQKNVDVYWELKLLQEKALIHANKLEVHHRSWQGVRVPNPSTQVHHLVSFLKSMALG